MSRPNLTDSLDEIMHDAMEKMKVISIHAAASMCDMEIKCLNKNHEGSYQCSCHAMEYATEIIKQRILGLLKGEI